MQVLIVYAHPSEDSFTRQVRDEFIRGLQASNHPYEISDLYQMNFKNAQLLAESSFAVPIIIAGNKNAAAEAEESLKREGKEVYLTTNVLPKMDQLQIEQCSS